MSEPKRILGGSCRHEMPVSQDNRTFRVAKPDKARRSRRRRQPVFAEFRRGDPSDSGEATNSARNSPRRNSAQIILLTCALSGTGRGQKCPGTLAAGRRRHDHATVSRGLHGVWRGLAPVAIGVVRHELTLAWCEPLEARRSELSCATVGGCGSAVVGRAVTGCRSPVHQGKFTSSPGEVHQWTITSSSVHQGKFTSGPSPVHQFIRGSSPVDHHQFISSSGEVHQWTITSSSVHRFTFSPF